MHSNIQLLNDLLAISILSNEINNGFIIGSRIDDLRKDLVDSRLLEIESILSDFEGGYSQYSCELHKVRDRNNNLVPELKYISDTKIEATYRFTNNFGIKYYSFLTVSYDLKTNVFQKDIQSTDDIYLTDLMIRQAMKLEAEIISIESLGQVA